MDGDFDASRDWVLFADAVEDDVDGGHDDLPHAVQAEKVAYHVEVPPLPRPAVHHSLLEEH